ncbi:MAG: hypothetical protein ACLQPD_36295 [Desulfomonilaceae bacterium]
MEIDFVSAVIILVAVSFSLVVAFLAFRGARSAEAEGAREAGTRVGNLCYECLGLSDLDPLRRSECASACGMMPT